MAAKCGWHFLLVLHNLSVFLVDYGSPEELQTALEYLQPAFENLGGYTSTYVVYSGKNPAASPGV